MPYEKDKVTDVLAVLKVVRREFNRTSGRRNITELRIRAKKDVAEIELSAGRYKDQRSAHYTIHDSYARRLQPDVQSAMHFDRLADDWLRQNSPRLKNILSKYSRSDSQRDLVDDFFGEKMASAGIVSGNL